MIEIKKRRCSMSYFASFLVLCAMVSLVFSLEVPLTLKETAGVGSALSPVTTVIPLKKGEFTDVNEFKIEDAQGNTVPAQFSVLNRWWAEPVQSIRHVLVNFQPTVSAFSGSGTGTAGYFLKDNGIGNATGTGLSVTESGSEITVITGPLKFIVNKATFNIIDQLWRDQNNNGIFEDSDKVISSHPQNGGGFFPGGGG